MISKKRYPLIAAAAVGSHLGWVCFTLGASGPVIAPSLEARHVAG